jgi:CheY-like chemotaxis protein
VQVKDSGVGIEASDVEHIFGRFKQASNRKVEHGGTGLGLAIVKELCQLHGGDVSVESTLGKGSTFLFHFAARKVAIEVNKAHQEIADLRGVRILVAEDNALNLFFIQTLLKRWGCNVTFVSDGNEAIEEWRSRPFDVILMDIQMPNCNGLEAAALIRSEEKKNDKAHLPIVALSAFAFDHDKKEALGVGMNDYLIKPYTEVQLMNVLRKYSHS